RVRTIFSLLLVLFGICPSTFLSATFSTILSLFASFCQSFLLGHPGLLTGYIGPTTTAPDPSSCSDSYIGIYSLKQQSRVDLRERSRINVLSLRECHFCVAVHHHLLVAHGVALIQPKSFSAISASAFFENSVFHLRPPRHPFA